jgi:hypothetical protein
MARPLSMDFRTCAMARLDPGEVVRAVAEAVIVAPSSVVKWSQRRRATGSAAPPSSLSKKANKPPTGRGCHANGSATIRCGCN